MIEMVNEMMHLIYSKQNSKRSWGLFSFGIQMKKDGLVINPIMSAFDICL